MVLDLPARPDAKLNHRLRVWQRRLRLSRAVERAQLAKVQALLAQLGPLSRSDALAVVLAGDVQARLALADQASHRLPLYTERLGEFSWWQGESSPLLQSLGAFDTASLRAVLMQQSSRLEELARYAGAVLDHADASQAGSPSVLRWRGIAADLERHRSGRLDSSLLALERYLLALAPDLSRSSCAEKLAAAPARTPAAADEFGQRHAQIHQGLHRRCAELRAVEVKVPGSIAELRL